MKEDTDSHRRVWKGRGGVGRADRHFRGRNDGRSRVTIRCSSLRQVPRENQRMWKKTNEFCLDMMV